MIAEKPPYAPTQRLAQAHHCRCMARVTQQVPCVRMSQGAFELGGGKGRGGDRQKPPAAICRVVVCIPTFNTHPASVHFHPYRRHPHLVAAHQKNDSDEQLLQLPGRVTTSVPYSVSAVLSDSPLIRRMLLAARTSHIMTSAFHAPGGKESWGPRGSTTRKRLRTFVELFGSGLPSPQVPPSRSPAGLPGYLPCSTCKDTYLT
ncbi:hypothetical protein B0T22DRAFT_235266 [Podospora appendiculata]|uniref:Uncharacterized protein n=1 Tax=Podospora appendiculata TaxID=314037 RepID=A0AAE0X6M1_9PEZI|nr:hypothetical protein B0T22DRAFT_235266 [Podospora appendiculata]